MSDLNHIGHAAITLASFIATIGQLAIYRAPEIIEPAAFQVSRRLKIVAWAFVCFISFLSFFDYYETINQIVFVSFFVLAISDSVISLFMLSHSHAFMERRDLTPKTIGSQNPKISRILQGDK